MSINIRTAERLSKLAAKKNLSVRVARQTKPARCWYSIGFNSATGWHQCAGFTDAVNVENYLAAYGK